MRDRQEEARKERDNPFSPYGPGAHEWKNITVESYLEAAIAWMEAHLGREHELPEAPSWKSFARFLYAGKYYE